MTPNLHRINIVLLVVKSDFVTNNAKFCCDSIRKVLKSDLNLCISLSRPAWDAWIEIFDIHLAGYPIDVASRMGRVD